MTTPSLLASFQRKKSRSLLFKGKIGNVFSRKWKRRTSITRTKHQQHMTTTSDLSETNDGERNDKVKVDKNTEEIMSVEVSKLLSDSGGTTTLYALASALRTSHAVAVMHNERDGVQDEDVLVRDLAQMSLQVDELSLNGALRSLEIRVGSTSQQVTSWKQAKDEYLSTVLAFPSEEPEKPKPKVSKSSSDVAKYMERIKQATRREARREVQSKIYGKFKQVAQTPLPAELPELVEDSQNQSQQKAKPSSAIAKVDEGHVQRLSQAYNEREVRKKPEVVKELEQQLEAESRASSLLQPLSQEQSELVESAMYGDGPENEIVAQLGTDSVQRMSLRRLQPGQWLNDEVIHYFMVMLTERDKELCRLDPKKKRSHFFKSFFMTKLLDIGNANPDLDGKYNYRNVKRWSKKVPGKDIFALDKIFFPVNVGGVHWICIVAFMGEKRIQVYDSMGSSGSYYSKSIFHYLQDEHQAKKSTPMPDLDKWEIIPTTRDTPQQLNGFDCGVFTCMFADFLSKDCPLVFLQEHVTQCRERITLSIMNGSALM